MLDASVLLRDGAEFPEDLRLISDPPERLFLAGRLAPGPRVALVGARRADAYGLEVALELGRGLGNAGVCVVSGGADGVDSVALEACLDAGGPCAAVLGTGLDLAYPKKNKKLFARIAEAGALISEYPEGTQGFPANFPKRNRLVSGLAAVVVVVQAAERSGSLITARLAMRQGKILAAVPGPVGSALSRGCHDLLRRGAKLVEGSGDVLRLLGMSPSRKAAPIDQAKPELGEEAARVYAVLGSQPMTVDLVAERCQMPSAQVVAVLLQLEFEGFAEHCPGTMYRKGRR